MLGGDAVLCDAPEQGTLDISNENPLRQTPMSGDFETARHPVPAQTPPGLEKSPPMQTHVLTGLEMGPVVQTQTLRDFEKLNEQCCGFQMTRRDWAVLCDAPEQGTLDISDENPLRQTPMSGDFETARHPVLAQTPPGLEKSPPMQTHVLTGLEMGPVVQTQTLRDFEKHLNDLKKENFSLKLRIYFLEERMQQKYEASREDVYKRNIELKVEVESLKQELQEKQQALDKACFREICVHVLITTLLLPPRLVFQVLVLHKLNDNARGVYNGHNCCGIGSSAQNSNGQRGLRELWDSYPQCTARNVNDAHSRINVLRVNACTQLYTICSQKSTSVKSEYFRSVDMHWQLERAAAENETSRNEAELQRRYEERQQETEHVSELLENKIQLLQEEARLAKSEAERTAALAEAEKGHCLELTEKLKKLTKEEEKRGAQVLHDDHCASLAQKDKCIEELIQELSAREQLIELLATEKQNLLQRLEEPREMEVQPFSRR
ncbi:Myomegalin [Chelonia mydas]|uniref:Myomegalin n=1 Tax=Chelonia mydas TaxID=8469 RepID=M7B9B5_CHEMY|nr:Myomegalin [Chelonia mydas]